VGEVAAVGPGVEGWRVGQGVEGWRVGQRAAPYGALTCGRCRACREGRDNLCENVSGVLGFHVDGFAQERRNVQARLAVPVPEGVAAHDAACAAITFSTVEHMLFDNARLKPGETILIQAGGSGIGTVAVKQAKALGCTVIATAGSDDKCERMRELGADHVVNYNTDRFESVCRKVTGKRGVDVVFEHVGAATWAGSLLSLRMGGRLVTCGSTSGMAAETNLMMLFQRQLRITGSFGASMRNVADGLAKMAGGMAPVLDSVLPLEGFEDALRRLESRRVFGKIVVTL
jgi:NADPH:quinone reductase-like Zn-dependent oxidoreductase